MGSWVVLCWAILVEQQRNWGSCICWSSTPALQLTYHPHECPKLISWRFDKDHLGILRQFLEPEPEADCFPVSIDDKNVRIKRTLLEIHWVQLSLIYFRIPPWYIVGADATIWYRDCRNQWAQNLTAWIEALRQFNIRSSWLGGELEAGNAIKSPHMRPYLITCTAIPTSIWKCLLLLIRRFVG